MIRGADTGIVKKMREYVGAVKDRPVIDYTPFILETLNELLPFAEDLQRKQWENNQLQSGAKMGEYEESTIQRWKKTTRNINLYQTGKMYEGVTATLNEAERSIEMSVVSDKWLSNYIHLRKNRKIGTDEDGNPAFIGLTEENEKILKDRFRAIMASKLQGKI
jgi:hypothetical protein